MTLITTPGNAAPLEQALDHMFDDIKSYTTPYPEQSAITWLGPTPEFDRRNA